MTSCACGCGEEVARTWVKGHHWRGAARERFLAKVACDERGCWVWTGTITDRGYGIFGIEGGTQ